MGNIPSSRSLDTSTSTLSDWHAIICSPAFFLQRCTIVAKIWILMRYSEVSSEEMAPFLSYRRKISNFASRLGENLSVNKPKSLAGRVLPHPSSIMVVTKRVNAKKPGRVFGPQSSDLTSSALQFPHGKQAGNADAVVHVSTKQNSITTQIARSCGRSYRRYSICHHGMNF